MTRLCALMGVSTSGYYDSRKRPESDHDAYDRLLVEKILEMHVDHYANYGAARVHAYLRDDGYPCSRKRINRLMKENGIRAKYNGGKYGGKAKDPGDIAENQLGSVPLATEPGCQWAGDMTHLKTSEGPIYMAAVLDLYHRKVIGWSFSQSHDTTLIKSALDLAVSNERYYQGCLFHSDQGTEYRSAIYQDALDKAGLSASMSRAGVPTDNAYVESFFGTLKKELVNQCKFASHIECIARIIDYIRFYNEERLHSGLNYSAPNDYQNKSN